MNYATFCQLVTDARECYCITLPGIRMKITRSQALCWASDCLGYGAGVPRFESALTAHGSILTIGMPEGHGTEVTP